MRKRLEWKAVQTYVPPPLHERLSAIRSRTGLSIDFLLRRALELSIDRLDRLDSGVRAATGAGMGLGSR